MNGRKTRSDQRIGSTVASAISVGNCSASAFGTSSPTTSCDAVSTTSTTIAAADARRRLEVEPRSAR